MKCTQCLREVSYFIIGGAFCSVACRDLHEAEEEVASLKAELKERDALREAARIARAGKAEAELAALREGVKGLRDEMKATGFALDWWIARLDALLREEPASEVVEEYQPGGAQHDPWGDEPAEQTPAERATGERCSCATPDPQRFHVCMTCGLPIRVECPDDDAKDET